MPQYSEGFRERAVQMMMAPAAKSVAQVSRETGASEQTLYNWRNRLRHEGKAVPSDPFNPESWNGENELAEYCREKGLYFEQIARWREAAIAGAKTQRPLSAAERRELLQDRKKDPPAGKRAAAQGKGTGRGGCLVAAEKKPLAIWGASEDD